MKTIEGKNFMRVSADFFVHLPDIERMEEKEVLELVIDLIHDGAKLKGILARTVGVMQSDEDEE